MKAGEQDVQHMRAGYSLLREALREFQQVVGKDNVIAHAVRQLGAIEDTLYEYTAFEKRRI